jgi:nucleoside-diphosphate-sugar epimerase
MDHEIAQPALDAARLLSGKRVFVTGATGMVGATLTRALLAGGATVHALARAGSPFWRIDDIADDIELHRGDITDTSSLERAIGRSQPQIVFHLATTRTDPVAANRVNVEGLRNLLDATRGIEYERFVVASSSLVCRKQRAPLHEDCDVAPVGFFGESKARAESLAQEFAGATGKPLAILRIFSVYGEWENPERLIPTAIRAAFLGTPIRLTSPGFRRDLIYVEDVAEALCRAASSAAIDPGEIINAGTGVETANEETVSMIEEACGRKIEIAAAEYPARETDSPHWAADPSKAGRALGWKARWSVRDGIRKTVEWMRPRILDHEQVGAG